MVVIKYVPWACPSLLLLGILYFKNPRINHVRRGGYARHGGRVANALLFFPSNERQDLKKIKVKSLWRFLISIIDIEFVYLHPINSQKLLSQKSSLGKGLPPYTHLQTKRSATIDLGYNDTGCNDNLVKAIDLSMESIYFL